MSVTEPGLQRLRMSWEDYLALPDDVDAEWVDGVAVVSPKPSARHGAIVARLGAVLQLALPELVVIAEAGVWLPGRRLRGPDLMVVDHLPDTTWVEEPPLLVVEVLSRSTRGEDTVVKSVEYLRAGIGQYWVVDPDARTIGVLTAVDGAWEPSVHLDAEHPDGEVAVGEHGVVTLDLERVLPA